jgi:hypothetical protein
MLNYEKYFPQSGFIRLNPEPEPEFLKAIPVPVIWPENPVLVVP